MMSKPARKTQPVSARNSELTGATVESMKWDGRTLPMIRERNGVWRVRSRSKSFPVDVMTGTTDLSQAKVRAREILAGMGPRHEVAKGTLEEAAAIYKLMPKKCSDDTAEGNISRLRSVVATAFDGAGLATVPVQRLPDLWHTYVAKRQGRAAADYSSRARVNHSINSAMRQAASMFRRNLWPHYRRHGIILPADAATVEYLHEPELVRGEVNDAALIEAWHGLAATDRDMWLAVGLARFAGLRAGEILACRGGWIIPRGDGAAVQLKDREEEGHWTKTGRTYTALVMEPSLAAWLLAVPADDLVITRPDAARWLGHEPQKWLRTFTTAGKPLHRLRGLYADHVRRETEDAILARQAGLKAASEALGHTTTTTTERHYTSVES